MVFHAIASHLDVGSKNPTIVMVGGTIIARSYMHTDLTELNTPILYTRRVSLFQYNGLLLDPSFT